MSDTYERLAKHLDSLPGGFPATDSGVELRILKRLFAPEEAELAMKLAMTPEPVSKIAAKAGTDESAVAEMIEDMAARGLVYRRTKGGKKQYMAAQFAIGIWEYQVNRLDKGLIRDFEEYVPVFVDSQKKLKTKQLRVIPVSKSVTAETRIMPFEDAENIIRSQSKIVVADCICRKERKMIGKGCGGPVRACFVFGGGALYYKENGLGSEVSEEEALEILRNGIKAGLVLQPGNSKKPLNICMCCGCCCQILKNIKNLEKPAKFVCTNYYATVDENECSECGKCVEKCPMDAVTADGAARVDPDRCIGCGVCAQVCDCGAVTLAEKAETEKWDPPKNMMVAYRQMAIERGLIQIPTRRA